MGTIPLEPNGLYTGPMSPPMPTFEQIGTATEAHGLVFACPHAGTIYPDDMRPVQTLSTLSLRRAEDARVDELIASAAAFAIPRLIGRVGRSYVDLNRAVDDLDPLLTPGWPVETASPRARAGYGVVPRLSGDGLALYDRALDRDEVEGRLERVHFPYHQALAGLMRQARRSSRHGRALLIDWHSMPAGVGGARGPDVVLGDRHGRACRAELTRYARTLFEREGLKVALNQPYAGGWTTQTWGRPDDGYQALQIELSRALYWDGEIHQPSGGWGRCLGVVKRVVEGLATFDR